MACPHQVRRLAILSLLPFFGLLTSSGQAEETATGGQGIAVGAQYDTAHVYISPDHIEAFLSCFIATFGGQATPPTVANILPVPSRTAFQAVQTPVGNLSVFAFQTPIPFPFGLERNGYLVTDLDQAIQVARKSGAAVLVAPFKDALGRDAVVQWPGGINMQLYWHFTPPSYAPLQTVPENRVYLSPDQADAFVRDFLRFSQGKKIADNKKADAAEIGRSGEIFRRIQIESGFGKMVVFVTDGHLPYPFGYDLSGYGVMDLNATLDRAKTAGASVLSEPHIAAGRRTAIVEFPGGYIAEVHASAR